MAETAHISSKAVARLEVGIKQLCETHVRSKRAVFGDEGALRVFD